MKKHISIVLVALLATQSIQIMAQPPSLNAPISTWTTWFKSLKKPTRAHAMAVKKFIQAKWKCLTLGQNCSRVERIALRSLAAAAATTAALTVGAFLQRRQIIPTSLSGFMREMRESSVPAQQAAASFPKTEQVGLFSENPQQLQQAINSGANINEVKNGMTPLLFAVAHNNPPAVTFLLERGADTTAKDQNGWMPLSYAASNPNGAPIIEELLKYKAPINVQNINGWTPLHVAAEKGNMANAQALLDNNAAIDLETNNGNTPLLIALQHNRLGIARSLMERGADIHHPNRHGDTPLHFATENPNVLREIVNKFNLQSINPKDSKGNTPLHWAAADKNYDSAKILIERGADKLSKNKSGQTPYDLAVQYKANDQLKSLLATGSNPLYR